MKIRAHFFVLLFATTAAVGQAMPSPAFAQTDVSASETRIARSSAWKTVSLGTYGSTFAAFNGLDAASVHIGEMAGQALHRPAFNISASETSVQLVTLSAPELGINEQVSIATLYAQARERGYELCPAEVAVQLRLQYRDQPVGEFLNIAMEPIATYKGELVGLSVGNGGAGLMIVGYPSSLKNLVHPSTRFVFIRPEQMARSMLQ